MRQISPLIALVLGIAALWLTDGRVTAATNGEPTFDPSPASDDLALPMPGGLQMMFRRIPVSGPDFWFHPEREVKLGDAGADDPFSGERRVRVMGAFRDADGDHWWYPIGKYEVSKAQFAVVMGDGDLNAGLERLAAVSGDRADAELATLNGRERNQRLAEPVRWIPWSAVQAFLHKYNIWLYADPERRARLPQLAWTGGGDKSSTIPGYLRLPSEIEWEYAARGGLQAVRQGVFEHRLPFPAREFEGQAWLSENARGRVRPIGVRKASFGLHDMLGNVSELVDDKFQPELEVGKVGGLAVRGGSVQTSIRRLHVGLRAEQPLYQEDLQQPGRMAEARPPFTGFRLAIGALVYPDNHYRQWLIEGYQEYAANFRNNAAFGSSTTASAIVRSSAPIIELKEEIAGLKALDVDLSEQTEGMLDKLQQIEQLQDQEIRQVVFELVENTILIAAEFGRNHYRWQQRLKVALPAAERLAKISTKHQANYQDLLANTQKYEHLVAGNFKRYAYFVERVSQYGPKYAEEAFTRAAERELSKVERAALDLVTGHVGEERTGRKDLDAWRQNLEARLAVESMVFQ